MSWNPALHPRDAEGQFTEKWAGRLASQMGLDGWKPIMTRREADTWATGSEIPFELYHGTSPQAADAIRSGGFDLNKMGSKTDSGNLGAGFYFTPDKSMAYGGAQGYGETLTVRAKVGRPLFTNSKEYARLTALTAWIDIAAGQGPHLADAFLRGPVSSSSSVATWRAPAGMTNRELIGGVDDGYLKRMVELQNSGGSSAVTRQVALDDGYDAIVWVFSKPLPGRPQGAETWYEVNVLRGRALTVVPE